MEDATSNLTDEFREEERRWAIDRLTEVVPPAPEREDSDHPSRRVGPWTDGPLDEDVFDDDEPYEAGRPPGTSGSWGEA
jgi:hypothetical protein